MSVKLIKKTPFSYSSVPRMSTLEMNSLTPIVSSSNYVGGLRPTYQQKKFFRTPTSATRVGIHRIDTQWNKVERRDFITLKNSISSCISSQNRNLPPMEQ